MNLRSILQSLWAALSRKELRPEYDFRRGQRGKYSQRYRLGVRSQHVPDPRTLSDVRDDPLRG